MAQQLVVRAWWTEPGLQNQEKIGQVCKCLISWEEGGGDKKILRSSRDQLTWYARQQTVRKPVSNKEESKVWHLRHTCTVAHSHKHSPTHRVTSVSVGWLSLLIMIYQAIPQFPIYIKSYLLIIFSLKTSSNFQMLHMVTFLILQWQRWLAEPPTGQPGTSYTYVCTYVPASKREPGPCWAVDTESRSFEPRLLSGRGRPY